MTNDHHTARHAFARGGADTSDSGAERPTASEYTERLPTVRFHSRFVRFAAAGLHLLVIFAPAWALGWLSVEQAPQLTTLAVGLTCLLLGDATSQRSRVATGEFKSTDLTSDDRRAVRLATLTGLALLAMIWGALAESAAHGGAASYGRLAAGGGLLAVGSLLRALAIRQLGDSFRTEVTPTQAARLVRDGLYARLRHPSETGLLLAVAGILMTLAAERTACLAVPAFAWLTWARLRLEERSLTARFGDEYQRYRREVPALRPLLYQPSIRLSGIWNRRKPSEPNAAPGSSKRK